MVWVAVFSSILLLILAVPVFLVFGIGSSLVAIVGLDLPWSTLIQVSFGAVTRQLLLAIPLFIFAGLAMLRGGSSISWSRWSDTCPADSASRRC